MQASESMADEILSVLPITQAQYQTLRKILISALEIRYQEGLFAGKERMLKSLAELATSRAEANEANH